MCGLELQGKGVEGTALSELVLHYGVVFPEGEVGIALWVEEHLCDDAFVHFCLMDQLFGMRVP